MYPKDNKNQNRRMHIAQAEKDVQLIAAIAERAAVGKERP